MYADYADYQRYGGSMPEEEALKALEKACRHIDTLTFNRIVGRGFDSLTKFRQDIIKECACVMADFESANADMINSLINNYSINGASISFTGESASCQIVNGVVVQRDIYAYLSQTGLCNRTLGVV